ncbi:MAG: hypothetical protein AAFW68_03310 [Pseudomonadota bacterium]
MRTAITLLFFILMGASWSAYAAEDLGRRVQTITHHVTIPEDGSVDEIKALTAAWSERVLKRNPNFADIQVLMSDVIDQKAVIFVLYTYSRAPLERSTDEINQELIAEAWPDETDRNTFFQNFGRYIDRRENISATYHELKTGKIDGAKKE